MKLTPEEFRARTLRAYHKASKAERAFDACLDTGHRQHRPVDKKDLEVVMGLLEEYWNLQEQIEDEHNTDSQMQRAYIDQQNDIRDELEVVYRKYLPVKNKPK